MNQTQVRYAQERVNKIAMCISGKITTKLNKTAPKTEPAEYTHKEIHKLFKEGDYKPKKQLATARAYTSTSISSLFELPQRQAFLDWRTAYDKVQEQIATRTSVVHLQAAHIIDKLVCGLITLEELPKVLEDFAKEDF